MCVKLFHKAEKNLKTEDQIQQNDADAWKNLLKDYGVTGANVNEFMNDSIL